MDCETFIGHMFCQLVWGLVGFGVVLGLILIGALIYGAYILWVKWTART